MSTQQDIYAAGSENRPPMLNKENYVPWSSRLLRYAKSRPNGKLIYNSIMNGPYVRRMIPEPGDTDREVPVPATFHEQTDDELTVAEIKQMEADDQAIQTILLGLPEDIYAAVDSCETAQEIWLRVQQMMKGSDIGIQEKKAKLFNEWERFTSTDGESIESYYHRFSKLMNDFKRNKHFPEKIASNLKFLNNLQPEWSRHVTIVHQTKDLHTTDYTQLYDFLKYNQKEVDDQRAERLAKTHDPLALMANSNNPFNYPVFHQDQPSSSTYMQQPLPNNNNYNPQPSFNQNYMQQPMPNPEDITDPTTAMNMALVLMAKAFKLNYSTPTNNNQRISSNPRNRQIAQPGMNMGQDRQMHMVGGNGRNQFIQYVGQNVGNQNGYNAVQNRASTSGTQTDKAPVYDSNGLVEFLGIVRFGNDHVAVILDLEVAFRRNTCFVRNLKGGYLLKGNRTTNLYTINLHEMASTSPICLMARATSTKSWLWHQRLSHLNFDTINDLAKNDLVTGLPKFKYHKEHLCPSCEQGKSKRASHPPKPVPNSKQRLHLLHMDLCGPMRITSINGKRYVLVIVDDYSRYAWVHFLRSKDEAPKVIKTFLKRITILLQSPVIIIRTDNKNQILKEYFDSVGISHQTSSVRTPQQNGVVNDREDIVKLPAKGNISFFIGYSADSCAYRVYNQRTKKIIETMNVTFDELSAMDFRQSSSKLGLQSMTFGQISSGLDLTYALSTITTQKPTEHELDLLFEAMHDDYIGGQPSAAPRTTPAAQAPQVLQTPMATRTTSDTAPIPTNSSSQATNFPNTS
ncbi:retrovirus-related pol polyprotein from transposon TNT 1-94 [Tanacetum coccineum]